MILLRLISWPYFRKHILRTVLTTAGIVLGVAVFVGMHTANQSVLFAFNHTIDRIAGKTELQVTAGETGFNEELLETVQSAASVRVAVPVIEAVVDSRIEGEGNLLILGTDMTGDRSLRDYDLESGDEAVVDDPLVFLAQPDSLILTKEFADKNHVSVNSTITLGTVLGDKTFTVRGIMKSSGLSSAFGGNLAIMDIYAAQRMFGRGRTFDRIDIGVTEGRAVADAQTELRGLLGPGFQIDPPSARGQQFEAMTAAYSMMVNISSLFALFIGMFIIYNAFAIAVTQRRSEIGILRALGATRQQIRWLFLGESAITGLVGSLFGVLVGLVIARGIAASIGNLMSDVYGVAERADEIATSPIVLGLALVIGVATSMIAALIPSRQAARVDPVQALQKGKYQVLTAGESRTRAILAVGARQHLHRLPWVRRIAHRVLRRLRAGDCGGAAARTAALARAGTGAATDLEVGSTRRRCPGRRQPHSVATPYIGKRRGGDVVARARRGVRGHGPRELQLDHRLDGGGAQSGSLRDAVTRHRDPDAPLPARDVV